MNPSFVYYLMGYRDYYRDWFKPNYYTYTITKEAKILFKIYYKTLNK